MPLTPPNIWAEGDPDYLFNEVGQVLAEHLICLVSFEWYTTEQITICKVALLLMHTQNFLQLL